MHLVHIDSALSDPQIVLASTPILMRYVGGGPLCLIRTIYHASQIEANVHIQLIYCRACMYKSISVPAFIGTVHPTPPEPAPPAAHPI